MVVPLINMRLYLFRIAACLIKYVNKISSVTARYIPHELPQTPTAFFEANYLSKSTQFASDAESQAVQRLVLLSD